MNAIIYEDKFFQLVSQEVPMNCRDDGGHLTIYKRDKVTDRSDMTCQEAIDFMRISMAAGRAMYDVLGVERINYSDLGNWSLDEPGGPKMHLHLFGRAREQLHQIRGHHMFFYPKDHKMYQGHLKPFTDEDIAKLRSGIESVLKQPKYIEMAKLAGVQA